MGVNDFLSSFHCLMSSMFIVVGWCSFTQSVYCWDWMETW